MSQVQSAWRLYGDWHCSCGGLAILNNVNTKGKVGHRKGEMNYLMVAALGTIWQWLYINFTYTKVALLQGTMICLFLCHLS